MLPFRNHSQNNASNKRKTKEGDWVCVRCGNYNYSFRVQCKNWIIKVIDAEFKPKTKIITQYLF